MANGLNGVGSVILSAGIESPLGLKRGAGGICTSIMPARQCDFMAIV